ncbi:MFS transporter [Candidatus Symbiopectobacterium sp. NZEC151]|uniref:MFS transporter n=2 Tax=unclassified Symbiopectobacterium TaxID=2794573 RepID=UPI002227465E|nr:MFS transporter [Candidatus Symbiopectobacterium sp. NZEC151]MCW2473972.1 MFS transporter [Candidatus Symbiopectobacterium sp. NZEC151]
MAVSQKELLSDSYYQALPAASGWQQSSHLSLAFIWMLGVVCVLDSAIISSLLTPIKAEFGFSDEQMGRFSSMFTLAGILGAPIMGTLANRFSRKTVLLIGATVWSVASLSTGLAAGFIGLLFWRVLTGFSEAAYNTVAPGWLADLYRPRWRNVVFSLYMLRNKIGTAAALALGSLLASEYGWRTAFFVAGLPGIVLVLLLLRVKEPTIGAMDGAQPGNTISEKTGIRDSLAVFRFPAYVLHTVALLLFFIAMSVQIWIPAYLHRVFALTNPQASGFLAQVLLYTLPMGLIGGYFSSLLLRQYRWGFPLFLASTSLLAALAFSLAYSSPTLSHAQVGIAAGIAAFGFSAGTLTTLIVETVPPHLRNSAMAYSIVLTSGLAGVIGPELVGQLSDRYTLGVAMYVAPVAYASAGAVWLVLALWQARSQSGTTTA